MFPGEPKKAVWTYYNTPPRLHLIYVSYPIYPPDQFNRAPSNTSTYFFFNKCKIPNSALLDLGELKQVFARANHFMPKQRPGEYEFQYKKRLAEVSASVKIEIQFMVSLCKFTENFFPLFS